MRCGPSRTLLFEEEERLSYPCPRELVELS